MKKVWSKKKISWLKLYLSFSSSSQVSTKFKRNSYTKTCLVTIHFNLWLYLHKFSFWPGFNHSFTFFFFTLLKLIRYDLNLKWNKHVWHLIVVNEHGSEILKQQKLNGMIGRNKKKCFYPCLPSFMNLWQNSEKLW